MAIAETLVIYTIIGVSVAIAIHLRTRGKTILATISHGLLWPFFAPTLFGGAERAASDGGTGADSEPAPTAEHANVRKVERKLLRALARLDGLAGDVLGPEVERIRDLVDSLDRMQARLDEMNDLLESEAFDETRARRALEEARATDAGEARLESTRNKLRHIEQLHSMRRSVRGNLQTALSKVDEISTQISLLRFADHPEREVSALIEDIAATVDGVSEGVFETDAP